MTRLRQPHNLLHFAVNFVVAVFAVCIFFGAVHIAMLEDEYNAIQDAIEAGRQPETRLQHAAREVCNDHPRKDGRELEPVWTKDGSLECHLVAKNDGGRP